MAKAFLCIDNNCHGIAMHRCESEDLNPLYSRNIELYTTAQSNYWRDCRPAGTAIVATETIYTLIAQLSCDQVCSDFQWLR